MVQHIRPPKIVKTRKQHTCFGCGRKFEAGTQMEAFTTVEAGFSIFSGHLCLTCAEISSDLEYGDEYCFGDLLEEALEREEREAEK